MARLDEVDLSVKLPKKDREERLERSQKLLAARRLQMAGKLGGEHARAAAVPGVRGLGRVGQGRGDQAPGRRARLAPRAGRGVRGADATTRSATTTSPASCPSCRAGAAWPSSTAPGTGACWSSASRGSPSEDEWQRAYEEIVAFEQGLAPRGDAARQVLDAHLPRGAAQALRAPRDDPAEGLEADRRGLAQPREAPGLRGRGRGDARAHRPRRRPLARHPGRVEEVRAPGRARHHDRGGRARPCSSTACSRSTRRSWTSSNGSSAEPP